MPTAEELTDPHLSIYVPVPAAAPGICRTCHGESGAYARCYSCNASSKGVSAVDLIVPVSLTRTDQVAQLHNVLRDYKHSPDPDVRAVHSLHVAALLVRFVVNHTACIERAARRSFDAITIVPSKSGRVGPHPLEQAIALSETLTRLYVSLLDPGSGTIGRNSPATDGFVARPDAQGKRLLLVDDTLTTGAKMQSAAHALHLAGANVVAGVALGRVIDVRDPQPDTREDIADQMRRRKELWERQARVPFSFGTCCLE